MAFDKFRPFKDKKFLSEVYSGIGFKFKLYGKIPFRKIFASQEEIDVDMGEIHVTEMDLKKLSELMDKINKKYKTEITYCLYHSSAKPGDMLLNIRGPKAPMLLSNEIKFSE